MYITLDDIIGNSRIVIGTFLISVIAVLLGVTFEVADVSFVNQKWNDIIVHLGCCGIGYFLFVVFVQCFKQ